MKIKTYFCENWKAKICIVSTTVFECGMLNHGELGQILIWQSSLAVLSSELPPA